MVKRYGGDAAAEASKRSAELEDYGDEQGAAVWRRIGAAIEQLQPETSDGPVH